jgi:hypothetical protein
MCQPSYETEDEPVHQKRNVISGLRKVDWSDPTKANEYLNCVASAMDHLGKKVSYDYLACISGCAFRGCCSMQDGSRNPSAYHVTSDIEIIAHTFRMLGYSFMLHKRSDYETDRKLIMDSIDKGIPVLTFHGVAEWSECCIISGYDDDGAVLLGLSFFCDYNGPLDNGYIRFSNWHDGWFKWSEEGNGRILIIGKPTAPPSREEIVRDSLKMAVKLIRGTASESKDWATGYAGHTKYAESVSKDADQVCKNHDDWDMLETTVACLGYYMYQDKTLVAPFLREAKGILKDKADTLEECATIYDQISDVRHEMTKYIAEDMSMGERIKDKEVRRQYAQRVLKIRDLEKKAADLLEKI